MIDSITSPATGYASAGAKPAESVDPSAAPAAKPAAPVTAQGSDGPKLVPDFSYGPSANYVLDWRDPATEQVLVQLPMRTALAQFAGSQSSVGKTVDTAV